MIPHNLIRCWFGDKSNMRTIEKTCIQSQNQMFEGWNIIEMNEQTFDVNQFECTKLAYEKRQYAFVADIARLYALINYGGIYIDTDELMLKQLPDEVLDNKLFFGSAMHPDINSSELISWGVVGSEPHNELLQTLFDSLLKDVDKLMSNTFNLLVSHGFNKCSVEQLNHQLTIDGITIYPFDYFTCMYWKSDKLITSDKTIGIQLYAASWWNSSSGKTRRLNTINSVCKQLSKNYLHLD